MIDICLAGAILGDIAGSCYEFYHPDNIKLFNENCFFTDDTVMNIATKEAINEVPIAPDFTRWYQKLGRQYPSLSYGEMFSRWIWDNDPKPYGSFGNGAAMRVAYIADFYETLPRVQEVAKMSAIVSHNHPHGILGAELVAVSAAAAKQEASKDLIYSLAKHYYPSIDIIEQNYQYNETCQKTVPAAIKMFCISNSLEDCFIKCIQLKGDSDTLCAIAGIIAAPYYGINEKDKEKLRYFCDDYILERIDLCNEL